MIHLKPTTYNLQPSSGFITLMSVIIVSTVGISIGVSILLIGLSSTKTSLVIQQSAQARNLTNACAEEALEKIRTLSSFSGTGSLTFGQGSCAYTVLNLGGQNRQVNASGTVASITRKAKVLIDQINPRIRLVSWQEVADF